VTSDLLLRGVQSGDADRWRLDERDEEALELALRQLVEYATEPERAAIVHTRNGEIIAGWNREGALRLARLLPPAYDELRDALVARYGP
jgi:hypothetical protein